MNKGKKISKAKKISLLAAFSLFAAGAGVCAANAQKISYGGTAYAASESLQGNAFTFTPGASVRADEVKVDEVKVTGIRFEAEIGKEKYDALIDEETNGFKENCEAGMIIVPAEVLTKWESQKDAEGGKADIFEYIKWLGVDSSVSVSFLPENAEEQENNYILRGVVNIKESNYLYDYQAAAYLKTDGTIVYDAFSTPRSLAYVANAAMLSDQETESKKTLLAEKLAKIVGMKFEKADYTLGENAASLAISDLNAKINLADYFADITAEDLTFKLESGDKIANLSGTELTFNNIGEAAVKVTAYDGKFSYTVKINATNEKIAELYTKVSAGSSLTTKAYIEEETNDAVLKVSNNVKLQDSQGWGNVGVHFAVKNNIGENNYLKFAFKFDALENENLSQTIFIYNGGAADSGKQNIWANEWGNKGIAVYDENGASLAYAQLIAGKWYEMYISITDRDTKAGDVYLAFAQNDYDAATEHPEIIGYIKNVSFMAIDEKSEKLNALKEKISLGWRVSGSAYYYFDGSDAAVKITNTGGNNWGDCGIHIKNVAAASAEINYVKFSYKFEAYESGAYFDGMRIYNECASSANISVSEWNSKGVACYDSTGSRRSFSELQAGQWYTFYVQITNRTGNDFYVNGYGAYEDKTKTGTPTTVYGVKNVDFVAALPE